MKNTYQFTIILLSAFFVQMGLSQIPETLSYQGVLTNEDGSTIEDGRYALTFTLHTSEGGAFIWSETDSADVEDGVFSVVLGKATPFSDQSVDFSAPLWLKMDYNGTLFGPIELTSSAYSMASRSIVGETNFFPSDGDVSIGGTFASDSKLTLGGNATVIGRLNISGQESGAGIQHYSDQDNFIIRTTSAGIQFEPNYVTDDPALSIRPGGNIGINQTIPNYKLDVNGDINFTGSLRNAGNIMDLSPLLESNYHHWSWLELDAYGEAPPFGNGHTTNNNRFYLPWGVRFTHYQPLVEGGQWEDSVYRTWLIQGWHIDYNNFLYLASTGSSESTDAEGALMIAGSAKNILTVGKTGEVSADTSIYFSEEFMVIDGSGNMGIGNTDPYYDLDVTGDINFTGDLLQNGSLALPLSFQVYNADPQHSDGYYYNYNNNYKNMLYHYSNFAIGVYQPSWDNGGMMTQSWMRVGSDPVAEDGFAAYSQYLYLGAGASTIDHYNNATAGMILSSNNGEGGNLFVFGRANDSFNATGSQEDVALSAELVVIDKDGNMGIGTNNPSVGYKLDVEGQMQANDVVMVSGNGLQTILVQSSENSAVLKAVTDSSNYQWTANGSANELFLYDNKANNGAGATRIKIEGNGNVGIGTDDPNYTLDVHGSVGIKHQELLPGSAGWKIYHNASDTDDYGLTFQRNGIDWMTLGAQNFNAAYFPTGRVGIGKLPTSGVNFVVSDTLTALLRIAGDRNNHVDETGAAVLQFTNDGGDETTDATITLTNGTEEYGGHGNDAMLLFNVEDQHVMTMHDGKVGIGTFNPISKLHIDSGDLNHHIQLTNDWTEATVGNGTSLLVENSTMDFVINQRENANIRFYTSGTERMKINTYGNVGINMDPGTVYNLNVDGNINADNWSGNSDIRWKKDISKLRGSLEKVKSLNGYHYNWKDESKGEELQIGVIAQEIEKVYPELVSTDDRGYKSVSYGKMVAPLIEAVKELDEENQILEDRIADLEKKMEILLSINEKKNPADKFGYLDK